MIRQIAIGAGVALGGAVVLAQAPAPAQAPETPRFRAAANVVVIEATVVDARGAVLQGLGPSDFSVEIDGRRRDVVSADLVEYAEGASAADVEITTNEPIERGRIVAILVDQSSLRSESRPVIEAARRWIMALGPRDRVGLMTFPQGGPLVEFTTDHAHVADVLGKVTGTTAPLAPFSNRNVSIWEAVRMVEQDTVVTAQVLQRECRDGDPLCAQQVNMKAKAMVLDSQSQLQPLLQSLRALVRGMGAFPGPKHAILLSSGWVMSEREAASEVQVVAADAARANVTVHTFTGEQWAQSAAQSQMSHTPIQDQTLLLSTVEMLSGMTGGRAVRLTGSYDSAFSGLNAGLSGYYRLGVQGLPEDLDGRNHRITLKVSRPAATLQNYRRVLAATPLAPKPAVPPETALREALRGGPLETALDLRATSYVLPAESGRELRVVVVGDVARAARGAATTVAALYEKGGRPVIAGQNAVDVPAGGHAPLAIELTAPPGSYALRLAVLDADGRLGSLERLVDVRWIKAGAFETPGLVLFHAARDGAAEMRPVFDAVSAGDLLIAQVALAGPETEQAPAVTFEILALGSTTPVFTRTSDVEPSDGVDLAEITLPVSQLEPGRYTLRATIKGGGAKPLTRTFTVRETSAAEP